MIFSKENRRQRRAFTLVEVIVSVGVLGISVGAIVYGYNIATYRAEWSAYSLAANALALQRIEQVRGAFWDSTSVPEKDLVVATNFPMQVEIMDTPISGTAFAYATNVVTIRNISTNPSVKLVRVDCLWSLKGQSFTNTVVTYRAPNN